MLALLAVIADALSISDCHYLDSESERDEHNSGLVFLSSRSFFIFKEMSSSG